jgi:hypothetical protein
MEVLLIKKIFLLLLKNTECYKNEKNYSIPLFSGAFYLKEIDSCLRRFYDRFDDNDKL